MKRLGHSKSSICAWLFRKSKEANEASFEPDMDVAYEMLDRKVRVQDVIDALLSDTMPVEVHGFLVWYETAHLNADQLVLPLDVG